MNYTESNVNQSQIPCVCTHTDLNKRLLDVGHQLKIILMFLDRKQVVAKGAKDLGWVELKAVSHS